MAEQKTRNWKGPSNFEDALVPIANLHADPANENEHTADQIQRMTISLQTHGQQEQLVVLPDDTRKGKHFRVIVGDARLRAADILGWTHLACSNYSEKAVYGEAYRVMSNKLGQMSRLNEEAVIKTSTALKTRIDGFDGSQIGYTRDELDKAQARIDAKIKKDAPKIPKVPTGTPPKQKAPPSAALTHLIEFDDTSQREVFIEFMERIGELNPELKSPGEKLMWYLAHATGENEPGWNGQSYTLAFANPDERNKWAMFLARLKMTFEGGDEPRADVGRVFLFLDEAIE